MTSPSVLKRLSSRERAEGEAVDRRRLEVRLLAALQPTGVVPRLVDWGEDDLGPWHRMEHVALPTLAERLEHGGPFAIDWIERVVPVALESLARIHEASDAAGPLAIVHGDLSPANLAIDDDGSRVVVLDFDLALWRGAPARTDGAFRGTIGYAAPEVARGEPPTPRSDLFSLAAALLHAATGRSPRPTSGSLPFPALLALAAEEPLLGPETVRDLAGRGPGHTALIRCLAHDAAARPPSARLALA